MGLPGKIQSLAGPFSAGQEGGARGEGEVRGEGEGEGEGEVRGEGEGDGGRKGVGAKEISQVEGEEKEEDKEEGKGKERDMSNLEDATELVQFHPYQWREWCFVRSRDCLYMWNEFCALELSNVSNGWFRFLIDSKLATMYSSGNTEAGPDSFGELPVVYVCTIHSM